MTENSTEVAKNFTSERFSELWCDLNHNQRRYVVAVQDYATKAETAHAIGIVPRTVYQWPKEVDEAAEILSQHVKDAAKEILARALAKAAMVKVAGLDSGDEQVRQKAATEIIERHFGKPTQRQEHTGADGKELEIVVRYADD